jgi:hypothetical protein
MTRRKRGENLMATGFNPANIWTLSDDRRSVRLAIPPVNLAGLAEPLKLFLDFDAGAVDELIDRLSAK